jgi:hypothetical protein
MPTFILIFGDLYNLSQVTLVEKPKLYDLSTDPYVVRIVFVDKTGRDCQFNTLKEADSFYSTLVEELT